MLLGLQVIDDWLASRTCHACRSLMRLCRFTDAGPAVSSDTACSSAVVATHIGVQHLTAHGGSVLTAGVNLMLAETTTAAAHAAGTVVCISAVAHLL
jgi:hypothetical protein